MQNELLIDWQETYIRKFLEVSKSNSIEEKIFIHFLEKIWLKKLR